MDINGAKALKRRLGPEAVDDAVPVVEPVDIPSEAPPIYRWTGKMPAATAPTETDDNGALTRPAPLFD